MMKEANKSEFVLLVENVCKTGKKRTKSSSFSVLYQVGMKDEDLFRAKKNCILNRTSGFQLQNIRPLQV